MGGVLGRPRRGLPDNPRYLPPGRYVRDVRDGDVLVLCSADAPLNLTVVPGRHPDDDGAWLGTSNDRGENDPEYALVRGAAAGAGGLVGSVVVDMRGRWATLRSPAAGDRYLLVDELARARDFERLESTGRRGGASSSARGDRNLMGLRFRERRRARRSACWGVEHLGEGDRAIVILRNRETPELCLRAVGPHPRTKSAAAVVLADFLREELASQMETRARLLALERSIDVERDVALEKLVAIRREHLAKSRALVHARRREGMLDAEQFLDGLTGVVDALRDQVKGASAEARVIPVSGLTGKGMDRLLDAIDEALQLDPVERVRVRVAMSDGATLHLLHERTRVISKTEDDEEYVMEVDAPESVRRQLPQFELVSLGQFDA